MKPTTTTAAPTMPSTGTPARWRVLVSAPYMRTAIRDYEPMLRQHGVEVFVPPVRERLEEDELLQWIGQIDGVICGDDRFTERVMRQAPRLKVISKWGTGIDAIDREAAARLGIRICNTPNAFSEPVADTVLGYMLLYARQLSRMDRDIRAGQWEKPQTVALRECTLGIIGVGNAGKAVARRAHAFGMRILGADPITPPADFLAATGLTMASHAQVFASADFVSINCDLNPTSNHLINEAALRQMKPTAILINTARGPIVEEAALVRALREGWIAGAALDVFEEEPLPQDSPLRAFDNCVFAPHNANSSPEAARRVHESSIRNLLVGLGAIAA